MGSSVCCRLRICGRVQGVGYRYAMCDEARSLGVTGWVRNRRDGSVEALLKGDPAAIEALVAWARRGPRGARVTELLREPALAEAEQEFDGFTWIPTA
jgi:acylphosphatase